MTLPSSLPIRGPVALLLAGVLFSTLLSASGNTPVSGTIGTNSVWSAAAAPFVVSEDVVVAGNAVLTVEPGVEIRFDPDTSLSISNGTLVARGTELDPIVFSARGGPPDADSNRWGAVRFANGAADAVFTPGGTYVEGSILEHTVLRFGGGTNIEGVIHVVKSHPYVCDSLVESNATGGVYYDNEDSAGVVVLSRNTIRHNRSAGNGGGVRLLRCSGVSLSGNTVDDNVAGGKGGGLYLQDCPAAFLTNTTLRGNVSIQEGGGVALLNSANAVLVESTIEDNEGKPGGGVSITTSRGVRLAGNGIVENVSSNFGGGVALSNADDCELSGNTIVSNRAAPDNVGGAIYAYSSGDLWLSGNTVVGNTAGSDWAAHGGAGLYTLYGGTVSSVEDRFVDNTATGVGGGLCLVQSAGCALRGSEIVSNTASAGGGVAVMEVFPNSAPDVVLSADPLNPSEISGNTLYNVYNGLGYGGSTVPDGPGNIDARYVWWNATGRSFITPTIYDYNDDTNRGYVVYAPFAVPVTPKPPVAESLAVAGNTFELVFANVVDRNICQVERSLDLRADDWEAFTNIVVSNSPAVFSWIEAETNEAAFYRIRSTEWGLIW